MHVLPDLVQLPPRSPMPMTLHSVNASGDVVPFASICFWIGDVRLTDVAAAFAAWAPGTATNNHGEWTAHNLPPGGIRLLATRGRIGNGSYDNLASVVATAGDVRVVVVQ